jgi:transcriptional regulator of aromatic amino acid metabolism
VLIRESQSHIETFRSIRCASWKASDGGSEKIRRGVRKAAARADSARIALLQHDWPGNVRELESLIAGAAITARRNFTSKFD